MRVSAPGRHGDHFFDVVFHLALVATAVLNLYLLSRRTQSRQLVLSAPVESVWALFLVGVWLVPFAFYLRTWAGIATGTTLWRRAPVVQLLGILVAATGAVAALVRLLGAGLVMLAQHGKVVSVDPSPDRLTVGMVHRHLLWEAADSVPFLSITGAFGWERPITDPGWPTGVAGILSRIAVSVFVLWTFAYLVQRFRVALLPRPGSGADT